MKKLTKAQEQKLHTAVCVDDLLYAKYEHILHTVRLEYKRLIADRKRIRQVIGTRNGDHVRLSVTDVVTTPDGTVVFVQL